MQHRTDFLVNGFKSNEDALHSTATAGLPNLIHNSDPGSKPEAVRGIVFPGVVVLALSRWGGRNYSYSRKEAVAPRGGERGAYCDAKEEP
ncbi:hypothetical protein AXG93_673s1610 [Marchantia polymorpha subsp. ruderalis]|uniref:Uncharacterized protein n=1 Tax=Marchantia polymorpha subsp. ruderalis TaxID=1480154 RepID=A0A176WK10_MARPO|nr:hypothetical protein AXG93_673s1610 [Marchantia polymorpha subsp. ruderalis]